MSTPLSSNAVPPVIIIIGGNAYAFSTEADALAFLKNRAS